MGEESFENINLIIRFPKWIEITIDSSGLRESTYAEQFTKNQYKILLKNLLDEDIRIKLKFISENATSRDGKIECFLESSTRLSFLLGLFFINFTTKQIEIEKINI